MYVCAILETTSAQVALQAASDSLEAGAERGSARQRVVLELAALAGLEPSAQQDEAAVLGELAAALCDPTAAQLLPLLVRRLLPPEQAAGDGQAAAAAAGPLPTEAAVLHAEALATRRTCSYLYCPHLALAGTSKLCARCRRVRYDSTACQRADWREHHKPGCIRT